MFIGRQLRYYLSLARRLSRSRAVSTHPNVFHPVHLVFRESGTGYLCHLRHTELERYRCSLTADGEVGADKWVIGTSAEHHDRNGHEGGKKPYADIFQFHCYIGFLYR